MQLETTFPDFTSLMPPINPRALVAPNDLINTLITSMIGDNQSADLAHCNTRESNVGRGTSELKHRLERGFDFS